MNDVHFVYEEGDQFSLTDIQETGDAAEVVTSEVQAGKTVIHEPQAKCGDVFVGLQGNFTLVCSICRDDFDTFDLFGRHIKGCHMRLKPEPKVPMEHLFMEPLSVWDDPNKPRSSSREKAVNNLCKNDDPTRTHLEQHTKTSQLTLNNSLQPNQQVKNFGAQQSNNIWKGGELNEESSSGEYTPENESDDKNQHRQGRMEYFCIYCCKTYKTEKYFVAHSKREHNIENPGQEVGDSKSLVPVTMVCKYCDKSFHDQIEFKNHVNGHTGPSRFVCPLCPKKFADRYSRKLHVNTHTGERPFQCTHCPKAFSDGRNLQTHIRMHLGIMKFSCDYCGKRFVQSTEKKTHERTHTGEKPYQCEECGNRFLSNARLMEHIKRHQKIKNYKCEECSKSFYNSTALKYHMRTHTGERPFLCTICFQSFSRRKSLQVHQKQHSKENKHECDICGKAFAQFSGLYSHSKTHTEETK